MPEHSEHHRERVRRFRYAVQRNRAASYALAGLTALGFVACGVIDVEWELAVLAVGVAMASFLPFTALVRFGWDARLGRFYNPLWVIADAALITWGVAITGGSDSPWFIWYLANIGGAAFVLGQVAAAVTALIDTALYIGYMASSESISLGSGTSAELLARMVFLYVAAFFFIRGVAALQHKQQMIERLRHEEERRFGELTRLTEALDQRTRELGEANVKLREADRLKSLFLANMSHELRTPLNSIIGFSDVILERAGELPERFQRFLGNIHTSGEHLLGIINDLLDLSKIEAGKMDMRVERFPVVPLVAGVCTVMRGIAKERGVTFDVRTEEDIDLEADPVKIKQVLYNLLANAVKFSPHGGVVRVAVEPSEPGDGLRTAGVRFSITDEGVGIDPKDHRRIFDEFRQADESTTRKYGGTGLGLALVRRFVELHAGTVSVDSALGEGATFTVLFPVAYQGETGQVEERTETLNLPGEGGSRVLVVEDDPTAYETLAGHLGSAGYIPVRARDAAEALHLAEVLQPAAITLDIILPGDDGWDVLRRLKGQAETADIPVVVVSMLENRELAVTLGAAEYLVKPVDGERLITILRSLVRPAEPSGVTVLLVDDDPDVHELVRTRLEPLGYRVLSAVSGSDGLELAIRNRPDVILLDLMMDGMDGFEVNTRLKTDPVTSEIPVVVLTAMDMTAGDRRRLRGSIEALVTKGVGQGRLVAAIDAAIRQRRRPPQP